MKFSISAFSLPSKSDENLHFWTGSVPEPLLCFQPLHKWWRSWVFLLETKQTKRAHSQLFRTLKNFEIEALFVKIHAYVWRFFFTIFHEKTHVTSTQQLNLGEEHERWNASWKTHERAFTNMHLTSRIMLRFQKFWVFWKVQDQPHPIHLLPKETDKNNRSISPTMWTNIGGYKLSSDHYRAMASMCTHNENESIHHREKLDISTKNPSPKKNWNRTSIFLCQSMPVLVAWVGTCSSRFTLVMVQH